MKHLEMASQSAIRYIQGLNDRPILPSEEALQNLEKFDEPFPKDPTTAEDIVTMLDEWGSPATVATTGRRYFGFVTGGILPAAMAANWLMAAWDQNASLRVLSPLGAKLEEIALNWLYEAFAFSPDTSGGFVTGATLANFTALAAARHHLLARKGWDVEAQGLFAAPEIKVVVGDEVHVSVLQALMMIGFGKERVIRVPVDSQGRIIPEKLPPLDDMTIVCIQAGNVNSGAFDFATPICKAAQEAGAWVHVDGAFGLWVLSSPKLRHLAEGYELADSWATDGHKWLNVSYDNGIILCRHGESLRAAMNIQAPYLIQNEARQPYHYVPEQSRRARGIEIWAALKSLGQTGLAKMIERDCELARYFAEGLRQAGFTVHNEVVINQVLVSFGDPETTLRTIEAIQKEGTFWAGQSVWQGKTGMRISVSSWASTHDDIDKCLIAINRVAGIRHS